MYTSQDSCVKERYDLNCDGVEMLWIEVLIPNFKLLVCIVYRPPGITASFWVNFDYSLEQALHFTENIIITGDLNVDLLTQTNHRLNEILTLYDLTNVINEPTRMGALLDPVIVSNIDIDGFFSKKKYSDSQCCWKKYSDFGGGKLKKIYWHNFRSTKWPASMSFKIRLS